MVLNYFLAGAYHRSGYCQAECLSIVPPDPHHRAYPVEQQNEC